MDLDVSIDQTSAVPPFEQLRSRVAAQVSAGSLPAGGKLPTVRALAADLGLAVNTVAKAYRALETDGVIETRGRAGTFVSSVALADPPAELMAKAGDFAVAARRAGLTMPEATALVQRAWSGR